MIDLRIDLLRLDIEGGAGQGHRLKPIAARAADVLAGRLDARWPAGLPAPIAERLGDLRVPPIELNLATSSNEEAATRIADAITEALALRLKI